MYFVYYCVSLLIDYSQHNINFFNISLYSIKMVFNLFVYTFFFINNFKTAKLIFFSFSITLSMVKGWLFKLIFHILIKSLFLKIVKKKKKKIVVFVCYITKNFSSRNGFNKTLNVCSIKIIVVKNISIFITKYSLGKLRTVEFFQSIVQQIVSQWNQNLSLIADVVSFHLNELFTFLSYFP